MEDWKDLVWFGLSMICVSFVLSFVSVFGGISASVANVRADEVAKRQTLVYNSRWATSDGLELYGVEVISLVRQVVVSGDDVNVAVKRGSSYVRYALFDDIHVGVSYAELTSFIDESKRYKVYFIKDSVSAHLGASADATTAYNVAKAVFPTIYAGGDITTTFSGLVIWEV